MRGTKQTASVLGVGQRGELASTAAGNARPMRRSSASRCIALWTLSRWRTSPSMSGVRSGL
eukprot:4253421-Pyramimonas_sp.AAC.1